MEPNLWGRNFKVFSLGQRCKGWGKGVKFWGFFQKLCRERSQINCPLALLSLAVNIGMGVSLFLQLPLNQSMDMVKNQAWHIGYDSKRALELTPWPTFIFQQKEESESFPELVQGSMVLGSGRMQPLKCSAFKNTLSGKWKHDFEVVCSIEMQHSASVQSKTSFRLTGAEGFSRQRGSETAGMGSSERYRSSYKTNCSN